MIYVLIITALIIVFIGLQSWWIIPILKKNKKPNESSKNVMKEIKQLERIFKK